MSLGNVWEEMVRNEMKVWSNFNHYWLTLGVPVLAVRYEDLLLHTEVRVSSNGRKLHSGLLVLIMMLGH